MVEDQVVAAQLEALLTPAITAQENYYRFPGVERADTQSTPDGGGTVDSTVARCSRSQGARPASWGEKVFCGILPHKYLNKPCLKDS